MTPQPKLLFAVVFALISIACRSPKQGLQADLYYLASPRLQGRAPKSEGDLGAQRYIGARFQQLGLEPWGRNKPGDFALAIPFGTNIAGVLRGSDPALADEYILVSAHHDHLGIQNGEIYPGACDNAAGVVAMLEIAREITSQPSRPRRSICFLATDAEEIGLFGAVAFACDKDFAAKKIVANVNMDCLGRTSFEAIEDALILVGSENYPALREQTRGAALAENLRILPLGSDVLGPRGDHVIFENLGIPSLFFTCGMYKDYHQPSDTPDRIDHKLLAKQTRTIGRVVNALANETTRPVRVEQSAGDREELVIASEVIHILKRFGFFLGVPKEKRAAFPRIIKLTEDKIAAPVYSIEDRQRYWETVFRIIPPGLIQSPKTDLSPVAEVAMAGMRQLIDHRASTAPWSYKIVRYGTRDVAIHLERKSENRYSLEAPITVGQMEIRSSDDYVYQHWNIENHQFSGTRDELIDACLVEWAKNKDDASWSACWQRIATKVAGESHGKTYDEWAKWRHKPATTPATAL
jgi:hypothetical protein